MLNIDYSPEQRATLLNFIQSKLETIYHEVSSVQTHPELDPKHIKDLASAFKLEQPNSTEEVLAAVIQQLQDFTVHTTHPAYYGLFNPRPNFISILADVITAFINPQLAAWGHAAYANEIERFVINEFGKKFGYRAPEVDGTFCTGGAASNLTAVIAALNHQFPDYAQYGLQGIDQQPIIYCSSESHHSIVKAAKATGLGWAAVQEIPVNDRLQMDVDALKAQLHKDKNDGKVPFLVVGTAGTTGAGAIDPLTALAQICKTKKIWFHVDAAYGGAAIITEFKTKLDGIEESDSITLDLHKWFSVPMGTSLFLTRHNTILHQSFNISASYMPKKGDQMEKIDPYIHSIQWSRRFIGLKIYLPLAIYGWQGYREVITHQIELGKRLKSKLQEAKWEILNDTPLPIVIFSHKNLKMQAAKCQQLVDELTQTGEAWLSTYPIGSELAIRACITNYKTQESDLDRLVVLLEQLLQKTAVASLA